VELQDVLQWARSWAAVIAVYVDTWGWKMIRASAVGNVAELGLMLHGEYVNAESWLEPASMYHRPGRVTILDVAMSSGAVKAAKLLLVFHNARGGEGVLGNGTIER
jgi:hypothetical protein